MNKIIFLFFCVYLTNATTSGAASPPVPKISATPASVNLGLVKLGLSSAPKVITVKNSGKSDLVINSVTTTETAGNEFSQTNNCVTILPGSSCLINALFTPDLPYANKTAILAIASNDPKKPLLNVKLSGTVPPPIISATPASVNLGPVKLGSSSAPKVITVNE